MSSISSHLFFFCCDTATPEIYTLSLHDALPILLCSSVNIQTACLIMEGAEFTENIINGVERPVKAAELFAFRSEERFSRNAETDLVCRLLLEKKNIQNNHFLDVRALLDAARLHG